MVFTLPLSSLASLLACAVGTRQGLHFPKSKLHTAALNTKFIAGVPVVNYHLAYGKSSLSQLGTETEGEHHKSSHWMLEVVEGTTNAEVHACCEQCKALSGQGCSMEGHPDVGGLRLFECFLTEDQLAVVITGARGKIQRVEPDQVVHASPEVPEPFVTSQIDDWIWSLGRIGAYNRPRTGAGINILIFDTGIRHSHQEFGGRAIPLLDHGSWTRKECNGDMTCATDSQGHGTHCAGTAGGSTYGVAPGALLRSVRVLGADGSGFSSWTYASLDWVVSNDATIGRPIVASMSLGAPGTSPTASTAIDAAVQAGVTVVVAGGNENDDSCNFSPSFVPNAITVGSTDNFGGMSSFSNYGACTNIWAPGSRIKSAKHTGDSEVTFKSGTSMACPTVAGAAAILLEATPTLGPKDVLTALLNDAETNVITGLTHDDTNKLLSVGAPTPAPAWEGGAFKLPASAPLSIALALGVVAASLL